MSSEAKSRARRWPNVAVSTNTAVAEATTASVAKEDLLEPPKGPVPRYASAPQGLQATGDVEYQAGLAGVLPTAIQGHHLKHLAVRLPSQRCFPPTPPKAVCQSTVNAPLAEHC